MAWSGARLESGSEEQTELGPEAPSEVWMEPQHAGAFVGRDSLLVIVLAGNWSCLASHIVNQQCFANPGWGIGVAINALNNCACEFDVGEIINDVSMMV
jgi:hypothetical protein